MTYENYTNLNESPNLIMMDSIEIEGKLSNSRVRTYRELKEVLKNEYQLDVQVKTDGTYGVDFEIVLPYMVITSNFFKDTLQKLCSALGTIGASTFESAGIHHNISLQEFNKNLCIEEFSKKSFKKKQNLPLNEFIEKTPNNDEKTIHPLVTIDVVRRIANNYTIFDSMEHYTRRDFTNRVWTEEDICKKCHSSNMIKNIKFLENKITENIKSYEQLKNLYTHSNLKYFAVNVANVTSQDRIEFRNQGNTLDFNKIYNKALFYNHLFNDSHKNRIQYGTIQISRTPSIPFRPYSRIGQIWHLARKEGGASTRELMALTGNTAQYVRSRISEFRAQFGDSAIVTHTQQSNGASYGDGIDLTRYEILKEFNIGTPTKLKRENRIGLDSLFANMDDSLYEKLIERIEELKVKARRQRDEEDNEENS